MYALKQLEFDKILREIENLSSIYKTREYIKNIVPSNDFDTIKELLNETDEARLHIIKYGEIPFGGIFDCSNSINKTMIGSTITAKEILDILHLIDAYRNIKNYYKNIKNENIEIKYLNKYLDLLSDLNVLKEQIIFIIDENGNVLDSASDTLLQIRKTIKNERQRLKNKLQEILQAKQNQLTEYIIVSRNDRMCLCVKQEFKNTFKGIIQDESSSGTTVYIEPLQTMEINNKIASLEAKERIEIERIMYKISNEIGKYGSFLLTNLETYIKLDFISAKAKYAIKTDSIVPSINLDGIIELEKARHPLIDKDKVVPLDLILGNDYQTIIITGPNTGGKTVALKTVGLLTIMMQSGLLVPCNFGSNLSIFDNVFVDIGDEQSIEQSLSTFSSHLSHVINITENLDYNSLVLLDELGSGTDPKEGSSLATSIIKYLMSKNARTIVTTHYSELKSLAYSNMNIINASVQFDLETLSPTYKMLIGIPGKSNALEIASRLGLKKEIIDDAKKSTIENNDDINKMIQKLEKEGLDLEKKIEDYNRLIKEENKKIEQYTIKSNDLDKKYHDIIEKANKKAQEIYDEAKEKAESILMKLKELEKKGTINTNDLALIKHDINELNTKDEPIEHINVKLEKGDKVLVIPYKLEGVIVKEYKDTYEVKMGNLVSKFKSEDLNFISKHIEKKDKIKSKMTSNIKKDGKLELDLRGFRYEEAVIELDKFIDQALLANYDMVYVIHGFGTGAIRNAVIEYLKKCKQVKSFRYGGEGEGLNGVTVVYFK